MFRKALSGVGSEFCRAFFCRANFNTAVLIWVLFFATGPFGTGQHLVAGWAGAFWAIIVLFSSGLLSLLLAVSKTFLPGCPYWLRRICGSLIFALVIVPVGAMIYPFFSDDMLHLSPQMPMLYLFAFCTAMLVFVTLGLIRNGNALVETDPSELEDKGPAKKEDIPLLLRLSEDMRGTLIRVSVQDHLVEVYTDKGMSQLRMRLRDALKEIPEDLGLIVHRSHWVSRAQVQQGQKSGGKVTLQLEDGSRVPVSRSYEAKARAEGWL